MTVQQIHNLTPKQIRKLSVKQLKSVIKAERDAINKRALSFEKKGIKNPTLIKHKQHPLSARGNDVEKLRLELLRGKQIMDVKRTTIKGFKKQLKNSQKALQDMGIGGGLNDEQYSKMWSIYSGIEKKYGDIKNYKYEIIDLISKELESGKKSVDDIIKTGGELLKSLYEENQQSDDVFSIIEEKE